MATGGLSSTSQRNITGYGQFCVDLADNLSEPIVERLARVFEFKTSEVDLLKRESCPAPTFVSYLEEKGVLKEESITQLTEALEDNDFRGIADKVQRSYDKNVRASRGEICHSQYPYVSAAKFEKYKHKPKRLDDINKDSAEECEQRFRNYSMASNVTTRRQAPRTLEEHLRIVTIGKTGCGKSATANSLLKADTFPVGHSSLSEIASSGIGRSEIGNGRRISVVDSPGLKDTTKTDEEVLKEIARMAYVLREGVHAFIFVWSASDARFSDGSRDVLTELKKEFGDNFTDYCLVVYTYADSKFQKMTLDDFIEGQKKHKELRSFFDEIGWKIVAVNNNADLLAEKTRNQETLIDMIDEMVSRNEGNKYETRIFREARRLHQEVEESCSDYHPALVTAVIELYNSSWALLTRYKVFGILAKSRTGVLLEGQSSVRLIDGSTEQIVPFDECKNQMRYILSTLDRAISVILAPHIDIHYGPGMFRRSLHYGLLLHSLSKHPGA